ncbi:T9SS type A sorting domain-containing protein [uncultured Psychroserpens sp.]|uniref:T9SS type A sorting domain-containing protein n=1 Tax=uncultured Psychroserpens sp. TaxID=255436 RepID=UPI002612405B|nr:T9SS type A sorting domain-containing protein [uncultured Psychroserpens sp.]
MKRVLLLLTITLFFLQPAFSQMEFVQDINLGANASSPRGFVEFDGKVYFIANNSSGNQSIFSIDANGTVTEANTFNFSVQIVKLIPLNGQMYATVKSIVLPFGEFSEPQLWRINFFGTDQILDAFCGNYQFLVYDNFVYNNELYMSAKSACLSNENKQLYAFNGSSFRLVDAVNPSGDFSPQDFEIHNNELYFRGFTSTNGWELYKTNGVNVTLAFEFLPGALSSFPIHMTSFNGYLYLGLLNEGVNIQLFKLDTSTSNATAFTTTIGFEMKVFNNELYFSEINTSNNTRQLAKLNTNDVKTAIPLGGTTEDITNIIFYDELDGSLYFSAAKPSTGFELYRYALGPSAQLIEDYNPGSTSSNPFYRAAFNNTLYFGADNGNGLGNELHKYTPQTVVMTTISDANFEQLLINLGLDSGAIDGQVPTQNIENVTALDISSMNVSNITGIEDFTALEEFTSIQNPLTTLDFSSNTNLTKINVINNPITSVNVSQNVLLEELTVSSQTFTLNFIDVSQNINLRILELGANNLTSLYVGNNPQLTYLNIGLNPIAAIDVSSNLLLESFGAYSTNLINLDLSGNFNLQSISAHSNNQLNSLNIKNGNNNRNTQDALTLTYLDATGNPNLTCIQVDNANAALNNSNWFKDAIATYSEDCSTLNISDTELEELINVHPNPSSNMIHIRFPNSINILKAILYDVQGKQLISKHLDQQHKSMDISKLNSGIYILSLETKSGSTKKRIIKQ